MRLSARIVTCSVAALVGIACSGTTTMEGRGQGGTAGAAGNPPSTRSSTTTAGKGGQSTGNSGGTANTTARTTAIAAGAPTTAAGGAASETGGSGGTNATSIPTQGGGNGGVGAAASGGNSTRAGSSSTGGGAKPNGGTGNGGTGGASGSNSSAATAGRAQASGGGVATGGVATGGVATGGVATGGVATGGTSTSSTTAAPPPSITTVSPSSGIVTTTVIISGQNFGATQGASTVKVAGSSVTPTYWSDTSIEVPIPRSIYPGLASITVTVAGASSNNAAFDVTLPRTVYINTADRDSSTGNSVAAFTLTAFGFIKLPNSPYISGDSGPNGGTDGNSLALHRATRRLFVLNDYSCSAFDIDPVTGELTRTANSPVSTGGGAGASGIVVNASGNLVYVTSICSTADNCRYSNASISAFKVSATGVLSLVSGSPFSQSAGGGGVRNPALMHGDQLLVATGDFDRAPPFNRLVVNSVNAATGVISPVTGSPFDAVTRSWSARPDPTGTWYYMSDTVPQLTGFVFQNSGVPALISGMPIATKTISSLPNSMAITANGSHLYMGSYDSNEVSAFSLSAGTATLMAESPRELDGVSVVTTLGVSRNGSQLVVADSTTKKLMVYPINAGFPYFTGQGDTYADIGGASGLVIAE